MVKVKAKCVIRFVFSDPTGWRWHIHLPGLKPITHEHPCYWGHDYARKAARRVAKRLGLELEFVD